MNPPRQPPPDSVEFGADRVVVRGGGVVIYAAREMEDWQVREFCRIPVFFRGRKYYLKRRSRVDPPYVMAYELELWPTEFQGESTLSITYDERHVAQRDRQAKSEGRDEIVHAALLTVYPLLGFFWSDFKDHKLERFGFHPRSITEASLYVQLAFVVCEVVFLVLVHTGFFDAVLHRAGTPVDVLLLLLCVVDALVRGNQVFRGEERPDGFLEWVFRGVKAAVSSLRK